MPQSLLEPSQQQHLWMHERVGSPVAIEPKVWSQISNESLKRERLYAPMFIDKAGPWMNLHGAESRSATAIYPFLRN